MKTKPKVNVVSDHHVLQFDSYINKWRAILNLRDWRIVREAKRDPRNMACLTSVEHEHKLAKYRVGESFKSIPVTSDALESTAIHELLHLMLRPLMDTCMTDQEHSDSVAEYEHAVIVVLEALLLEAYGEARKK